MTIKPRKQNSDEGLATAQALLAPLNAVDFVFFLTARHSSNKFALCARSVSSVPLCLPQGPLQNRLRKKIAAQSIFVFYALRLQVNLRHRHKKQKDAALRHLLASFYFAEREGFEPPEPRSSTVFKTAAIDHSAIFPSAKVVFFFRLPNFIPHKWKKVVIFSHTTTF